MTAVVLFPGQGVQRPGMGLELFDRYPAETAAAADLLGFDVVAACADGDERRLADTRLTQPLTYLTNALAFRAACEGGLRPEVVLGHSLGEFNALAAAGSFSLLDGLALVHRRAEVTSRHSAGGAMTAVQGLTEDTIGSALAGADLPGVELANLNTPVQVVLSGPVEQVAEAEALMRGLRAVDVRRLRITGAFHSSHMRPAAREYAEAISGAAARPPALPVVANSTARPHDPGAVLDTLVAQLALPVRWHASITWVLGRYPDAEFHQPGPSQVLVRMLNQIPAYRGTRRSGAPA